MNDQTLDDFRQRAVDAAGGSSHEQITDTVLARLAALPKPGSLLDFGAGRGALLTRIAALLPDTRLSGADYLGRPAGLPERISWTSGDLNQPLVAPPVDIVTCSEVIEHLENPRAVFRNLFELIVPGGWLILSMPNQESIRSYVSLLLGGHFVAFRGPSYPAHITALLRMDLEHMCAETGFEPAAFSYTDHGGLPKKPGTSWQKLSFGALRGRLFSDNIVMVARKPLSATA